MKGNTNYTVQGGTPPRGDMKQSLMQHPIDELHQNGESDHRIHDSGNSEFGESILFD